MSILRTAIVLGLSAASLLLIEGVTRGPAGFDLIERYVRTCEARPATLEEPA